jgi:signal transduction histidine kinase
VFVALFTASIAALVGLTFVWTQRTVDREVAAVLQAELDGLEEDYRTGGLNELIVDLEARKGSWTRIGAVFLLTENHRRLAGTLERWPVDATTDRHWLAFNLPARDGNSTVLHPIRALVKPLDATHTLLVGTDITNNQRFALRLRKAVVWTALGALLLASAAGAVYMRRVTMHVRAVSAACADIMTGNPSRRLPLSGAQDEFDALAATLNATLERLEQQTQALRTIFNSAAHDLRTPMQRARTRIEAAVALPDNVSNGTAALLLATLEDLTGIQATLTTLLEMARADAGVRPPATAPFNLAALVAEVAGLYRPEAMDRGLILEDAGHYAPVLANRELLAQLVSNLLENALKFVPAGGRVHLNVTTVTTPLGERVELCVSDTGPGIPATEHARVLLPFERLAQDAARPGSGLGLSLAASITRLFGGEITLENAHPGLLVRCQFPTAAAT